MTKTQRKARARVRRYAANILALYLDADDATRSAGAQWYALERERCADYARRHKLSLDGVAGAAAAISPGMRWESVLSYVDALRRNPGASVPTYCREFCRRAVACLKYRPGMPLEMAPDAILSGPKVRAFYALLAGRDAGAVVIDGHAFNIARGEYEVFRRRDGYAPSPAARVSAARYRDCAQAYREVAELTGEAPHAVQATTWIHWRNLTRRGTS